MKKNIYQFTVCCIIGFLIMSCKKDTIIEKNTTSGAISVLEVKAGVQDASFNYHEFPSALEIIIEWDTQNLYGLGFDSLDIDSDGSFDFFISLNTINEDSNHLLTGIPSSFPSCLLSSSNGLEFAFYTESFPIGLGQNGNTKYVDKLDFEERIDLLSNWQAQQTFGIFMWSENPGGVWMPPFGEWYYASTEKYIAIKMNGDKYGWIKIDASSPKAPKIMSYAIQN